MSNKFLKIGGGYYREGDSGSIMAVTDPDTLKGLKAGQLQHEVKANTEGFKLSSAPPQTSTYIKGSTRAPATDTRNLSFSNASPFYIESGTGRQLTKEQIQSGSFSPNSFFIESGTGKKVTQNELIPPQTDRNLGFNQQPTGETQQPTDQPNQPTTDGSSFKQQMQNSLQELVKNYGGVTGTADLEARRQALLRKQLLSPAYSEEGERTLTSEQKLSLMRQRGTQLEPLVQSLENQIYEAKQGDTNKLAQLQAMVSMAKSMGIFDESDGAKDTSDIQEFKYAKEGGYTGSFSDWQGMGGGGGGGTGQESSFTETQQNKGSANAGVSLSSFNTYSPEAQNTFINGDVNGSKSDIEKALKTLSVEEVKNELSQMNLPPEVLNYLNSYADSQNKLKESRKKDLSAGQINMIVGEISKKVGGKIEMTDPGWWTSKKEKEEISEQKKQKKKQLENVEALVENNKKKYNWTDEEVAKILEQVKADLE